MATQIRNEGGVPAAPFSVREAVTPFINAQERVGRRGLLFRMDYLLDDVDFDFAGNLSLVEYHHYITEQEVDSIDQNLLTVGDESERTSIQHAAVLRISEERMLPLGVWFWSYTNDRLIHLGD